MTTTRQRDREGQGEREREKERCVRPLSRYSSSRTPGRVSRFERSDWCRRVAPNLCSRSACAPRSTAPSPRRPFDAHALVPTSSHVSLSLSRLSSFALTNPRIRSFARFLRRRVIVLSFFLLFHSLSCSYTSRSRSRSRKMSRGFLSMSIKEREREWRKHRLDANRNCGENRLKYNSSWYFSGNIKALRVLSTRGPRSLLSRGN